MSDLFKNASETAQHGSRETPPHWPPLRAPKGLKPYRWHRPAVYFLYDEKRVYRIGQSARLPERCEELRRERKKKLGVRQVTDPDWTTWKYIAYIEVPEADLTIAEHALIKHYNPLRNGNRVVRTPLREAERAVLRRLGL